MPLSTDHLPRRWRENCKTISNRSSVQQEEMVQAVELIGVEANMDRQSQEEDVYQAREIPSHQLGEDHRLIKHSIPKIQFSKIWANSPLLLTKISP